MQNINKKFVIVLSLLCFTSTIFSQKKNVIDNRTFSNDLFHFQSSFINTLSSPVDWDSNDLFKFGGFLALSTGSLLIDNEINNFFIKNRCKTIDKLEQVGYYYGSPISTVPASLAMYLSGFVFDNKWLRDTGLMLTETISLIAIIQVPASFVLGRVRPHSSSDNFKLNWFGGFEQKNASFISGHTAIAVGISNILAHQINNNFATIGLVALAAFTPISRLYDNQHWFSDIVIGASLGYFISEKIIKLNEQNKSNEKLSITPTLNGIVFSYTF